ncbi:MAG: hypothetical protein ACI9LO_002537 [Planctomycetota bacterium]|jgi:hypothetical protein
MMRLCKSSNSDDWRLIPALLILPMLASTFADASDSFDYRGHIKYQSNITRYPDDSLFIESAADPAVDQGLDLRFNISTGAGNWQLQTDYQLLAINRESPSATPINDDRRLMRLTDTISEDSATAIYQRLDRLQFNLLSPQTVLKIGRQAVSWGNGLIYNPMDFLNPFDPTAIDREYKTGDDMLYAQYLFDNGGDVQAVWVLRRDDQGDVDNSVASLALKYHWFFNNEEIDLLIAEHFDRRLLGVGVTSSLGGSVWRGDLLGSETDSSSALSAIVNLSYSWLALGKNVSAMVELHRNGFGIDDGDYSPVRLAANPELTSRLSRGELFTLGKHYLGFAGTVELTALWLLSPNLFVNLDDDSHLLQLVSSHDLQQNLKMTLAASFPGGTRGSEFSGIDSGTAGKTLSIDQSYFLQLAWYF